MSNALHLPLPCKEPDQSRFCTKTLCRAFLFVLAGAGPSCHPSAWMWVRLPPPPCSLSGTCGTDGSWCGHSGSLSLRALLRWAGLSSCPAALSLGERHPGTQLACEHCSSNKDPSVGECRPTNLPKMSFSFSCLPVQLFFIFLYKMSTF